MNKNKRFWIVICIIVLLIGINWIPTFSLKVSGMNEFSGESCRVFYQGQSSAAKAVFELIEQDAPRIAKLLQVDLEPIEVYIYDHQSTMQTKKYGFISTLLQLNWYIGDNLKNQVILTSPASPGQMHSYESVLSASIHELVHAYNHQINPNMSYWLNNRLAGYLSGQEPGDNLFAYVPIPTLKDTRMKGLFAPIKFAGFGGYEYSYLYFEYLDSAYSWEEIVRLAKTGNYFDSLGVSEEEVYQAWVHYLSHK